MKLLPHEEAFEIEGFSRPTAVYRVDRGRVIGAWVVIVVFVLMGLAFVGIGWMFLSDPQQINKPVLAAVLGGLILLWLGVSGWMFLRLRRFARQTVVVYPEGFVVWQRGSPSPYRWEQIRAIDFKEKLITSGPAERIAWVGKDIEYKVRMDDGSLVVVNAMLEDVHGLGCEMQRHLVL